MDHIKHCFLRAREESRPLLVTYVTAGLPSIEETPDIMLGLQAGGAGESFSDSTMKLHLIPKRYYRIRTSLHRSDCRWTYNSESQFEGS